LEVGVADHGDGWGWLILLREASFFGNVPLLSDTFSRILISAWSGLFENLQLLSRPFSGNLPLTIRTFPEIFSKSRGVWMM